MTIARVAPRGAAAPIPTAGLAGQLPYLSLKEGESGAAAASITLGSQPAAGVVVTLAEQASALTGNAMQAIASTTAVGAVAAAAGFTRITIPAAAWNVPVTVQLATPRDIIARTAAAVSSLSLAVSESGGASNFNPGTSWSAYLLPPSVRVQVIETDVAGLTLPSP